MRYILSGTEVPSGEIRMGLFFFSPLFPVAAGAVADIGVCTFFPGAVPVYDFWSGLFRSMVVAPHKEVDTDGG
jgi:hypothetical protein